MNQHHPLRRLWPLALCAIVTIAPSVLAAPPQGTCSLQLVSSGFSQENPCPENRPSTLWSFAYMCTECNQPGTTLTHEARGWGACKLAAPCYPTRTQTATNTSVHLAIQNMRQTTILENGVWRVSCTTGDTSNSYFSCTCPQQRTCDPDSGSPIILSLDGPQVRLTGPTDGVPFDLTGNGVVETVAWTLSGSDDAFLALDRNRNGEIDDGAELFGDFTPQPSSESDERHGFRALAVFDDPLNGGDGDGLISNRDTIWSHLLLWLDDNHNGVSEPYELVGLDEGGVTALRLDWREARRNDIHGNEFRYHAGVEHANGRRSRAWDVFLVFDGAD